ncbi:CPBP family glutamic-type intramembrane protease [Algoriphagus sp. AGSA1]|uniref:CPBP family glutamic-type intramembrane protease n=1 Tax=Algoriphagus sp. AGSA1 TaxID=2907213 RepID=UPI001F45B2E8|nr:CPBP family glutamic-type intramembrane protease [Algoriphagus sp. AGSA1]MCE7054420.1 CPBP family glutamic-type intramembrane protease [Algoriphagus sp. AGSA1]
MTFRRFIYLLVITFLVIAPYSALIYALGLDELENAVMEMLKETPVLMVFAGIFIAPLLEEPIFRLHLVRTKKYVLWSLGLSVLLISEFWYPVIILWIYLIWLLIRISKNNPPPLKLVVYGSAVLFGLIHLGNFTSFDYATQFYLIPILVGAQFFVGLIISYIRLNHGMIWAMIFHGVYNGILIGTHLLFFGGGNPV